MPKGPPQEPPRSPPPRGLGHCYFREAPPEWNIPYPTPLGTALAREGLQQIASGPNRKRPGTLFFWIPLAQRVSQEVWGTSFSIQMAFSSSTSSSSLPTTPSAQWLPSFAGHVAPPPSRAIADAAISAAAAANAALGADRIIKHPARPEALRSSKRTLNTLALVDGSPQVSPSLTYNAGISACEKGEQWQRAVALLSEMWEAMLEPDVIS